MADSQFPYLAQLMGNNNSSASPLGGMTTQQKADSYSIFNRLMDQGIPLSDVIKRLDTLESKVKEIEEKPKDEVNEDLKKVMYNAVKDDPLIISDMKALQDRERILIVKMCREDPAYRELTEKLDTDIHSVYIQRRENVSRIPAEVQASDGEGAPEVRNEQGRRKKDKEGVSPSKEGDEE